MKSANDSGDTILEVKELNVHYGRNQALKDVNLSVAQGQIVTVLGANGAGKSSLLRTLIGNVPASSGQMLFRGQSLAGRRSAARVASGLVLVPEGRRILITMSIEENLLLGAHLRGDVDAVCAEIDAIYQRFPNLGERRHMQASCLSGGEQQMLAIGRALLAKPHMMMLDEPSLGLSPLFVEKLFELIVQLRDEQGITILLVEQNAGKALGIADKALVLELGRVVREDDAQHLLQDDALQRAYLGAA